MSLTSRVKSWLRAVLFERRLRRDMDREWRFHLEARIDALIACGRTRGEAERLARAEFGNVLRLREECREARGARVIDEVRSDVRYALRQMRRSPGFALAVVLTLALGIGTNAAIFSVVNAVLVRPLAFPQPDRLVRIWESSPQGNLRNVVSAGNFFDWKEQATSFEEMGIHVGGPFGMAMTGGGEPVRVGTTRITASSLRALGARAEIGRIFETPDMEAPAGAGVVLISHAFWQQQFGGDPAIVGRVIRLNDRPNTIVGVMPEGFDFPDARTGAWVPPTFAAGDRSERKSHQWRVVARLKAGVSLDTAQAELRTIASRNATLYPESMKGWSVNVVPLHRDIVGDVEPLLIILAGLALVVLLAACANLASLLLARVRRREAEFALRAAVGAGQGRLFRQIVTEVLLLGGVGGALGVGAVTVTLPALLAAAPGDIPLVQRVAIDPAVVAFAAGLTLVTSLAVGLVPAWRVARRDLRASLQASRVHGDAGAGRVRSVLLVSQFALSVALVIAAGLLVRSFSRLATVDYGFDPARLVEASMDLPAARYGDQPSQERFYTRLLERARALPGVESAALASDPPLYGSAMTFSFVIDGRPATGPSGREDPVNLLAISPGYFETLGVPVRQGRAFAAADRRSAAPVVVINQTLADRLFVGASAVGHRVSFAGPGGPWYEVIGVVGDTRDDGLDEPAATTVFVPYEQRMPNWSWLSWQVLVVRARPGIDPSSLAPGVRRAVWSIDPDLPLLSFDTVNALYAESAARRRFAMQLAGGFALLALMLCVFGVYGVVSYSVGEREREIGVRLALGARPGHILRRVMTTGVGPAAVGIVIGTVAAALLTRLLQPLLFGVAPTDPATFGGMVALLMLVAAVAAWVPARRATLVDPARSLRGD
jgi:predicted permease